jgi:hemolysin-activating ACP:hemolysin acyltransferase
MLVMLFENFVTVLIAPEGKKQSSILKWHKLLLIRFFPETTVKNQYQKDNDKISTSYCQC